MKYAFIYLAIIAALAVASCYDSPKSKPSLTPLVWNKTDPETWLRVMEIWKCDDGGFEVRTSYTRRGKYETFEEAQKSRNQWAADMVAAVKRGDLDSSLTELPSCGKRLAP